MSKYCPTCLSRDHYNSECLTVIPDTPLQPEWEPNSEQLEKLDYGAEQSAEFGYRQPLIDVLKEVREEAKAEERERCVEVIENHFEGLILMPDPQASKEKLLEALTPKQDE